MRQRRVSLRGAWLAWAGILVAGCSSNSSSADVPAIADARDVRGQDPCRLVTTEEAAGLGLTAPGTRTSASEGPRCEWRGATGKSLSVTLYTDGGGLATLAAKSEPTTTRVRVAGYPALETFTGVGEFCQYDIGVADNQAVVTTAEAMAPDSCSALQGVFPVVLAKLPPHTG